MIDLKEIDYQALIHPDDDFFKVFRIENTPEFHMKVNKFKEYLQTKYLYTSDEHRTKDMVERGIANMFFGPHLSFYYEIGDFQGLIIFTHIVPEHKADMIFKIWDKTMFSKGFVRACRKLVDVVIDTMKLKRITTRSADPKMVKLAKMAGFTLEGESPCDMKWNGEYHTSHTLGLVRD